MTTIVLSSVLDPRFRLKWTSSRAEEMAAKSRVIEHMDRLVEQTSADDHTMRLTEQGITDCMFAQDEHFGFMSNDQQAHGKVPLLSNWTCVG